MWCKIENNQLIYPPKNFRSEDGTIIMNFDKNEDVLIRYGYQNMTEEEIQEFLDSLIPQSDIPQEEQEQPKDLLQMRFSKLKIKEKLVQLGMWSQIKKMMTEDEWQSFLLADDLAFDNSSFSMFYQRMTLIYPQLDEILISCQK